MYYTWWLAILLIFNTTATFAQSRQNVSSDTSYSECSQAAAPAAIEKTSENKLIAGYLEKSSISICGQALPIEVDAKLDTGADSTSFHATDIVIDKKHKKVTFTTVNSNGGMQRITCPYKRIMRVKKRPSGSSQRPVIAAQIRIASQVFEAEVNLTDRTHFSYKLLIGRKELRNGLLIDPSQRYRLGKPVSP
ncbi:ATP-dependent zinc protease family protein [Halodesulfovibrio aestuarii]|uniref:Uncharacterized conserved protein n=1 Tax=Halodesulfovibrio aestuarii TaxID=126333 RepID=A0A8G2C8G2_9BACT|nr:RimK/LysX family protein [Halodesulfovibrio aestuarii]SHI80917.1 Uncharacterized conserved protein [Halodesulfovibrio aestuarii]